MSQEAIHHRLHFESALAKRSAILCLGILWLTLSWVGAARAQLEPTGDVQRIDFGYNPAFAVEPGGAFGLAWVGRVRTSFPGMMFDENGEATSGRIRVHDEQPDREVEVGGMAVDGSGNYLVAWSSHHISGSDGRLRVRFFDNQGEPRSPQFDLVESSPDVHYVLHGAVGNYLGDFVVLWTRFEFGGATRLQAVRFDSQLRPVGDIITVRTGRETPDFAVFGGTVAIDVSGRFVVTWQEWKKDSIRRLCFRRFGRLGQKLGRVRVIRRLEQTGIDHLTVATEPSGEFAIAWEHEDLIRLRFYDPFGRSLANLVPVGRQEQLTGLTLARDSFGNTVVLWADQEGPIPKIFARVYDWRGKPLGEILEIGFAHTFSAQFADDGVLIVSLMQSEGPHFVLAYRRFEMTCGPGYAQSCDPAPGEKR